jgi:polyisoprenyl-phosphate glycosyltransferase
MHKVSVIIPAYNEEEGIGEVLERLHRVLRLRFDYELIVVDDGSTDNTLQIAKLNNVKIVENPVNTGYGFSLKRGIRAAENECIFITDADGTYPLERMPEFIDEFHEGFDMIVGARQGKAYTGSVVKSFARFCFKIMSEFVTGKKIPDINSGFRVMRRSKMLPILGDLSNTFSFTTSSTLIFFLQHNFIKYIPIEYKKRKGKSKVKYVRDALVATQIMADIIARYNPIKLFMFLSFFPFACFLFFLGLSIYVNHYGPFVVSIMCMFFVIILMAMGFLATMFKKT